MAKSGLSFNFDFDNFAKKAKEEMISKAKEQTYEIDCPKCSNKISVKTGSNTCPNCESNVDFELKVNG